MKKLPKIILRHIVVITAICLFICVLRIFNVTCLVKAVIKIDCPACGTTRALISFLKLDFKGYFYYQPMALPLCAVFLLICHFKYVKHKKLAYSFMFSVAALNFVIYVLRQCFFL